MSKTITALEALKTRVNGYWAERIISQLEYAYKVSNVNDRSFNSLIDKTVGFLEEKYSEEGTITKAAAQEAEHMILELSDVAKSYKMLCAAHAHIDMNWMWGFAETVAVTLDTFRTMLNLMKEYPGFRFSQSQASVYRIVEEYDLHMLEEIKTRVKEGRWEVTASTWVETDKNMPNGESLARHILYTKKYLSKLFDLNPDSLSIDFEPDTFGHSRNVPEILAKGGVKYYYHCRGFEDHIVYKWEAPSGNSVVVYREPLWYNSEIKPSMAFYVPEFCSKHGIDTMLKVYGVGDHGGGPTRRDIEKITDMSSWPVFPEIRFGTFGEYFGILEKISSNLPVVKQELNFIFTGCYTTQTRIKMANRISEAKLNEAEAYSAISAVFAGGKYRRCNLEKAWEKVLFNHFHDILPGSGVIDTREYAMGQFQQVLAAANTETSVALRNIAAQIDTFGLIAAEEDISETVSEGAGVGYAVKDFGIPQTERGRGKNRLFHFFNPSAHDRGGPSEIVVWDWPGDKERIMIKDASGNIVRHQLLENEILPFFNDTYWGHSYIRLLVDVNVPAYGFSTYALTEKEMDDIPTLFMRDPRVEKADCYLLENDHIKVAFDIKSASIISLIDKAKGSEVIGPKKPAGIFRLIEEDDGRGMTAWVVGRYMSVTDLNRDVKIGKVYMDRNSLRQWISYEITFRSSRLKVTVSLDYNSRMLNYDVECDWQEKASIGKFIPQLNLTVPVSYKCASYKYDVPCGTIERDGMEIDVPANSWMAGIPEDKDCSALMLVTDTKYGFRGADDSLSVTLIRSSYDPDPYPEIGIHKFRFAVGLTETVSNRGLIEKAFDYNHPMSFISVLPQKGILPATKSFISLKSGNVAVSAVKMPEYADDDSRMIIRVYETEGVKTQAVLKFAADVAKAWFVDINEKAVDTGSMISVERNKVVFDVEANNVVSICVQL